MTKAGGEGGKAADKIIDTLIEKFFVLDKVREKSAKGAFTRNPLHTVNPTDKAQVGIHQ